MNKPLLSLTATPVAREWLKLLSDTQREHGIDWTSKRFLHLWISDFRYRQFLEWASPPEYDRLKAHLERPETINKNVCAKAAFLRAALTLGPLVHATAALDQTMAQNFVQQLIKNEPVPDAAILDFGFEELTECLGEGHLQIVPL